MELKIGLKKRKPISTHFFSNFINDLSTVEVNYHYTPVISGLSVTFISNVGVILIHFYGRRAFRSNGLDSRLLSMRANRMPRVIERAWLLKGVTETGSAPQVPGYRWIHLSFPLLQTPFSSLCYFINPFPLSPPLLVFILSFFPLSSTRTISIVPTFFSPFDPVRRSIVKNLSRLPHARSRFAFSSFPVEGDRRRASKKEKGRERETERGDHGKRKRLSRNDLPGKGV